MSQSIIMALKSLNQTLDQALHAPDILNVEPGYPNLVEALLSIANEIGRLADVAERMSPAPKPPAFVPQTKTATEILNDPC